MRKSFEFEKQAAIASGSVSTISSPSHGTLVGPSGGASPLFLGWLSSIVGAFSDPQLERKLVEEHVRNLLLLAATGKPAPGRRFLLCALRQIVSKWTPWTSGHGDDRRAPVFPFQALLPLRKGLRELLVPGSLAEQSVASDILTFVDARLATSGVLHPLPAPRDYQKAVDKGLAGLFPPVVQPELFLSQDKFSPRVNLATGEISGHLGRGDGLFRVSVSVLKFRWYFEVCALQCSALEIGFTPPSWKRSDSQVVPFLHINLDAGVTVPALHLPEHKLVAGTVFGAGIDMENRVVYYFVDGALFGSIEFGEELCSSGLYPTVGVTGWASVNIGPWTRPLVTPRANSLDEGGSATASLPRDCRFLPLSPFSVFSTPLCRLQRVSAVQHLLQKSVSTDASYMIPPAARLCSWELVFRALYSGVSPLDMDWLDTSQRQEPCARMGMVKSASPTSLKGLRPTQVPSSSARLLSRPSVRWLSSDFMSLDASVTSVTPVSTTLPSPAPAAHPPSGRNTFEMATPASGNVFCPFDGSYQFPTLVFRPDASRVVEVHSVEVRVLGMWKPSSVAILDVSDMDTFVHSDMWNAVQSFHSEDESGQEFQEFLEEMQSSVCHLVCCVNLPGPGAPPHFILPSPHVLGHSVALKILSFHEDPHPLDPPHALIFDVVFRGRTTDQLSVLSSPHCWATVDAWLESFERPSTGNPAFRDELSGSWSTLFDREILDHCLENEVDGLSGVLRSASLQPMVFGGGSSSLEGLLDGLSIPENVFRGRSILLAQLAEDFATVGELVAAGFSQHLPGSGMLSVEPERLEPWLPEELRSVFLSQHIERQQTPKGSSPLLRLSEKGYGWSEEATMLSCLSRCLAEVDSNTLMTPGAPFRVDMFASRTDPLDVFRVVIQQFSDDLKSSRLFVPTSNTSLCIGNYQGHVTLNPGARDPDLLEQLSCLGKIMALCLLNGVPLEGIQLSQVSLKRIFKYPADPKRDVQDMDQATAECLEEVLSFGSGNHDLDESFFQEVIGVIRKEVILTNGETRVLQGVGDPQQPLKMSECAAFVREYLRCRLRESDLQARVVREGFAQLIPLHAARALGLDSLRSRILGSPRLELQLLQKNAQFSGNLDVAASKSSVVQNFWSLLRSLSPTQLAVFWNMVSGKVELTSEEDSFMRVTVKANLSDLEPILFDSSAKQVTLPLYSTRDILAFHFFEALRVHQIRERGHGQAATTFSKIAASTLAGRLDAWFSHNK
mgnify:FL=1